LKAAKAPSILAVVALLDGPQEQSRTLLWWQRLHERADGFHELAAVAVRRLGWQLLRQRDGRRAPSAVEEQVVGDTVEPGAVQRIGRQRAERTERAQARLLAEGFGVGAVAETQAREEAGDRRLV